MNDIRQLRHFVALAEHGHFARAAEAVHLSQPALSRSIQALEAGLGCLLVDRHARGVTLTAHGLLVLEHSRRILASSHALRNAVGQLSNLESGELLVGAGPFPAARMVPAALAQFAMAYPKVQAQVRIDSWKHLREALLRGELEVFVADTRDLDKNDLLHVMPLTPRPGVMACRPGHPLLKDPAYTPLKVLDYPLVCAELPVPILALMERVSDGRAHISVRCDSYLILRQVVLESDAITLGPWDAIGPDVAAGVLACLPRGQMMPPQVSQVGIVTRQDNTLSPAAEAFCRMLLDVDAALPAADP